MVISCPHHIRHQHGANDVLRNWIPASAGMAHHQILLELGKILLRDRLVVQRTEARVDAIDRCIALLQPVLQVGVAAFYGSNSFLAQADRRATVKDELELAQFEADGSDGMTSSGGHSREGGSLATGLTALTGSHG